MRQIITLIVTVFCLASCWPDQTTHALQSDNDTDSGHKDQTDPVDPITETASNSEDGIKEISKLDQLAKDICSQGQSNFGPLLPDQHGFAARGADARVLTAWNLDGKIEEFVTYTPDLEPDTRLEFDGLVANFLSLNLIAGSNWSNLTGAYRSRDGRFCVVQTNREAIAQLRDAVMDVQ